MINLEFNRFEAKGNCENFGDSVIIKSPILVFHIFILSGPSGGLRHPWPAQLHYYEELAGLVGHYSLFMGSDGKVPWDSSRATTGEG